MDGSYGKAEQHFRVIALICVQIAICCTSLVFVAWRYPEYHIFYRSNRLFGATVLIFAFALTSPLFAFARMSFGYVVGFYFYSMIVGYLWLNFFSEFTYNHALTGFSAAAACIAFLLPALFISSPVRQIWVLSSVAFDRLLSTILVFATATIAFGAYYNFRFVSIENIYSFREELAFPTTLNYLIGVTSNTLLPFAFASFVGRKNRLWAGGTLVLMLLFYPITLSKLVLFTPVWLLAVAITLKFFSSKTTAILSLLVPTLVGVVLFVLFPDGKTPYIPSTFFYLINLRMAAIPSLAMDYYNYFFSTHDLTHFCQITFLKKIVSCPYQSPLAIVIYNAFGIGGYLNASLFATEGIASVGPLFAPFSAFACGLVIGIANRLSAGLPSRFVLTSGGILCQVFLNVPFSTVMLTHGALVLFLLWYLTPRTIFEPNDQEYNRDTFDEFSTSVV